MSVNKIQKQVLVISLLSISSLSLNSCGVKNCAQAQREYEESEREYQRLNQELSSKYSGTSINNTNVDRISNDFYSKMKPLADQSAAKRVEFIQACKSK